MLFSWMFSQQLFNKEGRGECAANTGEKEKEKEKEIEIEIEIVVWRLGSRLQSFFSVGD